MSEKFQDAIRAAAEMTQLERNQVFGKKSLSGTMPKELVDAYHDIIVEQCAQVCDDHFGGALFAEAIRKLKFK